MKSLMICTAHQIGIIRVIKSRRVRRAGHAARTGDKRGAYRVLVGRPEGERPLGIPKRKWENNIKMYLQEVGWKALTGLIWLRIGTGVESFECGNEPSDSIK
jgi:hypothetical protein